MHQRVAKTASGLLGAGLLTGCASGSAASTTTASPSNVVTITRTVCGTGWRHPHAGTQSLQIRNASGEAIEVSLINSATSAVYARIEGIGPDTTRSMPVDIGSGSYAFQCDGNNYSERIGQTARIPGHVPGGVAILPVTVTQMFPVTMQARAYVSDGLTTVMSQVTALAAAIHAGDLARAKKTWLSAHLAWTKLGSAYGMFSDYDDEINGLPDGLPRGVHDPDFTGFYRLEYGLWHGQTTAELTGPADQLVSDVTALRTGWPGMALAPALTLSDLALRTHEVLENAMRFQLSGQDNFGSGTTMATMAASIDATMAQLRILHPLLVGRFSDWPALYSWLDRLQRLVDLARTSRGWTPSTDLSAASKVELDAAAGQSLELLAQIPPMFEAKAIP
jgi:iron uptake system component EfeO